MPSTITYHIWFFNHLRHRFSLLSSFLLPLIFLIIASTSIFLFNVVLHHCLCIHLYSLSMLCVSLSRLSCLMIFNPSEVWLSMAHHYVTSPFDGDWISTPTNILHLQWELVLIAHLPSLVGVTLTTQSLGGIKPIIHVSIVAPFHRCPYIHLVLVPTSAKIDQSLLFLVRFM